MSIYPIYVVDNSSCSLWTFLLHESCFHIYPSSDNVPHPRVYLSHHFLNNMQNFYNQDSWSTSPYNEIRIYHIYYQPLCLHQQRHGTFLHFRTSFSCFLKCIKDVHIKNSMKNVFPYFKYSDKDVYINLIFKAN